MSYEYLAGFFDADGTVGITGGGYPFVAFCQAVQYDDVLTEMFHFLVQDGVKCGVYDVKPRPTQFAVNHRMTTLKVNSIASMVLILNRMLPFLRVKKERAERVLDHISKADYKTAERREPRIRKAAVDYQSGIGLIKAAANHGIAWTTLRKYLIANSIHIRTQSEAKKIWWGRMDPETRKKIWAELHKHKHPLFSSTVQPTSQRAS